MFRFLDTNNDASLSLYEFQKPVKTDATRLFKASDINDDNAIDFVEFMIMMSAI